MILTKVQVEAALKLSTVSLEEFWAQVQAEKAAGRAEDAKELIKLRCAVDIRAFATIFFPHYCALPFNPFHEDYFSAVRYGERRVRRSRCAPRGSAKSTLAALIKPLHDAAYGLEKFIVIISNTQPQANGKLKDIRNEILNNADLVEFYGLGFPKRNPGETEYIVLCGDHKCKFEAKGAGVQIRGIRFNEARPSKFVLDDVEHSEEVVNEEIRRKYEQWLADDVFKAGDQNTNIEFIGTMLHEQSLLASVMARPAFNSKLFKSVISWAENEKLWQQWEAIYTNLDNDSRERDSNAFFDAHRDELMKGAQVLWPEKEPYIELMKELINDGMRSFMRERQNTPMGDDTKVFDKVHWYRETDEGCVIESSGVLIPWRELQEQAFGVIDPATGKKRANSSGDFTCILSGYKEPRGRLLVHRDWTKREPPTKYIKQIFDEHEHFKYQKFGVEENLYRELLIPNLKDERARIAEATKRIVKLAFYEIDQSKNKIERITAIEPKVTHGWLLFNRSISKEAMNQLMNFPPASGGHDDFPDALEMLWGLVHNRYRVSEVSLNPMSGR